MNLVKTDFLFLSLFSFEATKILFSNESILLKSESIYKLLVK